MALVYESACPACGSVIKHCVSKTRVGPAPEKPEYDITDDASVVKSLFTPTHGGGSITAAQAKAIIAKVDGKCVDCGKPATCESDGCALCDKCNRTRAKMEADVDDE